MNHHEISRGIGLSVFASALFAFLSGYTHLLAPLDGMDIFSWRILCTTAAVLVLIGWRRHGKQLRAACTEIFTHPGKLLMMAAMAAMLGVQQWLFLWAPVNGRALEVSLGYFLLPLAMVLVGRIYFGERLDALQRLAVLCAFAGVAHELWMTRAFSWPTLLVALGYPPYFVVRRRLRMDSLMIFAIELFLLAPVAAIALACSDAFSITIGTPSMYVLLPGLGVVSMVALACYLQAGKLLPMGLFGILGYVEPVLLVLVAIAVLGESLQPAQLGTYVPIWLSVALTAMHSVRLMRRPAN